MPKGKARDMVPPHRTKTFDEFFGDFHVTPSERAALVWHLAAFRARKTVEALLPETRHDFDPRNYGLRAAAGKEPHDA